MAKKADTSVHDTSVIDRLDHAGAGDLAPLHKLVAHRETTQTHYFAALAAQLAPAIAEGEALADRLDVLKTQLAPRLTEIRAVKWYKLEDLGAPHLTIRWIRQALKDLEGAFDQIMSLRRLRRRAEGLADRLKDQGKGAPEREVSSIRSRVELARAHPGSVVQKMADLENWVGEVNKWVGTHAPAEERQEP